MSRVLKTYDEVAHVVRVAGVDEKPDAVVDKVCEERRGVVHAVALHQKRLVDLEVAGRELDQRVRTDCGFDFRVVHPCFNPAHLLVAERGVFLRIACPAYVVWVQSTL